MARRLLVMFALMVAVAAADASRVSRASMAAMESSFRGRLASIIPDNPFVILNQPHGVYLEGFGAVLTADVNLNPGMSQTPFGPSNFDVLKKRAEQTKRERLPMLRRAMQETLVATAASLDGVPAKENIAVSVIIYAYNFEKPSPFPRQIVMQAPCQGLRDLQAGRTDRAKMDTVIQTREF